MMKNIKKKKGFTLIELIIVIAIIGILAAIAVPKFGDIQKNSKVKADIASAKTISDAVSVLVSQNKISETVVSGLINTATGDTDLARIGAYLQSIPVSSVSKGVNFTVVVSGGNATVSVGALQVYPKAAADTVTPDPNPYND